MFLIYDLGHQKSLLVPYFQKAGNVRYANKQSIGFQSDCIGFVHHAITV